MKLFNRLKNIFKKESKVSGIIVSGGSEGSIPPDRNYEEFAKETYLKNTVAFAAIREIARSVASVPWKLSKKINDKIEDIKDDPQSNILKRANPSESFNYVMLKASAYLAMCGNSYFEKVKLDTGENTDIIREIYSHRPDRMSVLISKQGKHTGYEYKVGSNRVTFKLNPLTMQSDILHLKEFHPTNDWYGASPTESTAHEIDTSNFATRWNRNLLERQGRPGMVYKLIGEIGDEAFDRLEMELNKHTGPTNIGKNVIITGDKGTDVTPYGWNPADLDFNEGDLRLCRKIAMGYGVPPMLLGIPGEATFANYKEARLSFWETTIFYYLNYMQGELNNWLFEEQDDKFIRYILDDVPALSIKRDALWKRANDSNFLTINQKLEMVGKPTVDNGDVILVPSNMMPLDLVLNPETEEKDNTDEKVYDELIELGYNDDDIKDIFGKDFIL